LHERDQKEESNEKYSLEMVYHVIFENDKPVIYRLFDASTMRQRSNRNADKLTLIVLSKKFSECLGLTLPFAMLSRVDAILGYVSWILGPSGSMS
jgi:hypothetical protein